MGLRSLGDAVSSTLGISAVHECRSSSGQRCVQARVGSLRPSATAWDLDHALPLLVSSRWLPPQRWLMGEMWLDRQPEERYSGQAACP
eukprot:3816282-Amphidinium_carterae.3